MNIKYVTVFPALLAVLLVALAVNPPSTHASTPIQACHTFPINLKLGQQDSSSSAYVESLQSFLANQGYFTQTSTGYFGPITFRSVQKFQAAHGVPATGFVGPLTRAAITKIQPNCGVSVTTQANLYALSPDQGPIGTKVSIRGFGFSNANTILIDGMVAARDVPIASSIAIACTTDPSCHGGINQTVTFTLPEYVSPNCPVGSMCPLYMRQLTAGTTTISVQNGAGESNKLGFTITN